VCTAELCAARDDISYYAGLDAEVFGISVDSPFTLAKFREENNLPFHLLSDFNKEASTAYDALIADFAFGMKGVGKRASFVIDADGHVAFSEVLASPGDMPNFEAVKAAVAQASAGQKA
jgi:glutaredoxin-dependent peroxiredoxin